MDRPKSWLLGAGYSWRTARQEHVVADRELGLALSRSSELRDRIRPPSTVIRPYRFGALEFEISRERREVRAYDSAGRLRHCWSARDQEGNAVSPSDQRAWDPVDLTGDQDCVFLLDERYQIVYLHRYGRESLVPFVQSDRADSHWTRLAMDQYGCLLVFDSREEGAKCYGRDGRLLGQAAAPWPSVVLPGEPPQPLDADVTSASSPTHQTNGYWLSKPIDSKLYACQWHRIELMSNEFPPGSQFTVKAYAYGDREQAPVNGNDPRLVVVYSAVAPIQPPPDKEPRKQRIDECLVRVEPGQYLSVLIALQSDGYSSPIIDGIRLHYPRQSYLEYLPPLYSTNKQMKSFLEAFLSCIQTQWDEFDRRVEESEAYFDPDAVPEGQAMKYLAGWIGLKLEGEWNGEQNRRLLKAMSRINQRRGTASALRDYVGVYLANLAGLDSEAVARTGFPVIVEGFRERQGVLLAQSGGAELGRTQPLWSEDVMRRLRLGEFAQEGQVELVSTGAPEHDFVNYWAHKFRMYIPAIWVRTAKQEQMIRRAIETEMPAHVTYELCLVKAGVRVGIQSTVGLNTILGDPGAWRLPAGIDDPAPSLPPLDRLAEGTFLSRSAGRRAILDASARVGDWTLD